MEKTKENKCDLCEKDRGNFEGLIAYHSDFYDCNLCRSCYSKWNYNHREFKKSHKHLKSEDKVRWRKMCRREAELFEKWFKKNKQEVRNSSQA